MVRTPLYCVRFIGRELELAALHDLAARAVSGAGALAIVSGEAGIGKTRLLGELVRRLPRALACFRSACLDYAASPIGPIAEIDAALAAQTPAAGGRVAIPGGDDPGDKRRLFAQISARFRAAAAVRPFVMILDDLHWADTATLELVDFLARALADAPVLIVVAYRSDELDELHPVHALIVRLARLHSARCVELRPLDRAQTHELIVTTVPKDGTVSHESLCDVRDKSEGNPLFAEELLKAVVDRDRSGETDTALPMSLRGLLLERVRKLSPDHLRLLGIAALIGRRFGADFLGRVSGAAGSALETFLRAAVDAHFLVEDAADPDRFAFRHALVRETVLASLLAMQARAMHRWIAEELEREPNRDARVAELADHTWHGGLFARCAAYSQRAGDALQAHHAHAEAAEQYERALACGVDDERRLVALHEAAAASYASSGAAHEALEHLLVPAAYYESAGDFGKLVETYLAQALAFRRTAQTARAFEVLRQAAELGRDHGDGRLRFAIAVQLGQLHALAERWGEVETNLREAEAHAGAAVPRDQVRFHTSRAALCLAKDDRAGWRSDSEAAVRIAWSQGDPTLVALALTNYGVDARKLGEFDLALASFAEATHAGRAHGPLYNVTFAKLGHANVLYLTGRLSAARAELLDVLADFPEPQTLRILVAQIGIALAVALRDEELFGRCFTAEVLETAFATAEPIQFAPLAAALAEKHLADGDGERARAVLSRMVRSLPDEWDECEALLPVAVCSSRAEVERARRLLRTTRERTTNRFARACWLLFGAYAEARFGTRAAKLREARQAAAAFHRLGLALFEAEAYELAEQGPRALAICERIGARRLPRRLGATKPRRSGETHLTARERQVVDLVRRKLSNGAVADELGVSERTVEAHLAAVYRKLGVRSRGELISVLQVL